MKKSKKMTDTLYKNNIYKIKIMMIGIINILIMNM